MNGYNSQYSRQNNSYPINRLRPQPVSDKKYLLFTMSKCSQCRELKGKIDPYIRSGKVIEYDLDTIRTNSDMMNLFMRTSPNRNVPAMAIVENNMLVGAKVGSKPIMQTL